MKMYIKSVMVDDQAKAHAFYTDILGFQTKHDIPMGEHRWLSLVSPEEPDGVELLLEPSQYPPAAEFLSQIKKDGMPWTSFSVTDMDAEYERLSKAGVHFTQPPMAYDGMKIATFDDTCGNLIQIIQLP